MEQPATYTLCSSPGEYAPWMTMTNPGGEHILREKSLQFIGRSTLGTSVYWTTANAPVNPTNANQYTIIQCITNYVEYLSGSENTSGFDIVSLSDFSSVGEATWIDTRNRYGLFGHPCQTPGYLDVQLRYELVTPPKIPWMAIQAIRKEEEQETIHADTNRALSFKDLVSALDRISRPTEREDIPLPFDPDDYPVV